MSFADLHNKPSSSFNQSNLKITPSELAILKLEQFQRQIAVIQRVESEGNGKKYDPKIKTTNLQDRINFALLLQEEVAKQLALVPDDNAMQKKKLCKDFYSISNEFEKIVKSIQKREISFQEEKRDSNITAEHNGEVIEFKKLDSDIAHNEVLIEERDKEIAKIHQSVAQVNEIFKDLATLVQDQQAAIDDIESNIQDAHARTQQGLDQVRKAADSQRTCNIQ